MNFDEAAAAALAELNLAPTETAELADTGADEPEAEQGLDTETGAGDEQAEDSGEHDESESDDDEAEGDEPETVELDPEAWVLIDGERVQVKDALELKAHSTRKAQEAARIRQEADQTREQAEQLARQSTELQQQLTAWRQAVLERPTEFVTDLVKAKAADPLVLARDAIEASEDPETAFVMLLGHLVDAGRLGDELVETFNLADPAHPFRQQVHAARAQERQAKQLEQRFSQLEQRLAPPAATPPAATAEPTPEQAQDAIVAEIASIAQAEGIDGEQAVTAFTVELIEYAQAHPELAGDLARAYDRLQLDKARSELAASKQQAATAAATSARKKRAAAGVTPRSGSNAGTTGAGTASKPLTYADAAAAAVAELLAR